MATKKERITEKIIEFLEATPSGLQYSELASQLQTVFPVDKYGTIAGAIRNLDPELVYKPSRGLFRCAKYKEVVTQSQASLPLYTTPITSEVTREADFYRPFADYLQNDLEGCTKAISLGGNKFPGKWGTPDVFGIFRSRESDIVKMPLEVSAAEIKIDTSQLITAFGQACAYKLFAHRSYLVIPRESQPEDIGRLDSLCLIFGIGLILFDATRTDAPAFQIRVRAAKHEPDAFYVNQNVKLVADQLGL